MVVGNDTQPRDADSAWQLVPIDVAEHSVWELVRRLRVVVYLGERQMITTRFHNLLEPSVLVEDVLVTGKARWEMRSQNG